MERHDAARFDLQSAHAEHVIVDLHHFLGEIDMGKHRVGDALGHVGHAGRGIGAHLVGRAGAGNGQAAGQGDVRQQQRRWSGCAGRR